MSSKDDDRWMSLAIDLAWQCPPSSAAYSVGAVVVAADGTELSRGFSREDDDPHVHAEESALGKLARQEPGPRGATIYSTLEPCSQRKSRPRSCTGLIIDSGIRRVVIAWREPSLFVADCQGYELLRQAGLAVTELPQFTERAMEPNRHLGLLPRRPPCHSRPVPYLRSHWVRQSSRVIDDRNNPTLLIGKYSEYHCARGVIGVANH
jgi:diaminohydroxyphosphoribosylaminopyrimidine deaminase / 5-amino-6-(5-phosphoribosylamino)uracil reductase